MLTFAPLLANADLVQSYLPWLVLRIWMIGFALYATSLARRAGGLRRIWRIPYGAVALVFAFVWGPDVKVWAVIDWFTAGVVAVSALFLRTEPAPTPSGFPR